MYVAKDELLASLSNRFVPSHINSIFTLNTPILYLSCNNSYMIYIIRNPILLIGYKRLWRRGFVSLFFDRRCSADYFFRNVSKMAAWIPDNKKR